MEKYKIIENKAKCLLCGNVIESVNRHDYVTCSCGNISVDGGKDYLRRCFVGDRDTWIDLSISEEVQPDGESLPDED